MFLFSCYSDLGRTLVERQNQESGFDAECPNNRDICCEKQLVVETDPNFENCADDPDYQCVGIQVSIMFKLMSFFKYYLRDTYVNFQDCSGIIRATTNGVVNISRINLRRKSSQNQDDLVEEIFKIPVHIEIDNRVTTCQKDIEVCCKKESIPQVIPTPRASQLCGIHNSDGLEMIALDPSDGQTR